MDKMTARQVADIFEKIAPIDSGIEGDQLGFVFGDPETEVRGLACMWNAHSTSIQAAIDLGLNMLIVHEGIFYRPQTSQWYQGPERDEDIVANRNRRRLLEENNIVIYRSHSNWDALPEDGVADQAVKALGIEGLVEHGRQRFFSVSELSRPMSVKDLAERARQGLGLPWVRTFGNVDREVTRFAFLIGGFGENQTHMPQAAVEMGAEAIIIGEMNEFEVIAALECGVPVIETLHSYSESPAIRRQAEMLQERLPDIEVRFIDSGCLHFSSPKKKPTPPPRRSRDEAPFTWHVSCGMPTYSALAGVRFDRIFGELDAIVEAYSVGEPRAREMFGPDVRYGGPAWSGISYGHVNGLGSKLTFPEDSEVGHAPIYASLSEGIEALKRKVDWAGAGMMPFYIDLWEKLKAAFPDHNIPFGAFGKEGPITTGWEMRGHGFFTDPYDDPERYREFMHLVTESILDYDRFLRSLNGQPAFSESGAGLVDDVAAMFGPHVWSEWVQPFIEQYFRGLTSGRRRAHIEDLVPDHLHFLDALGLDTFDPGVSPRLKATDLRDGCSTVFLWRLNGMQVRDFSCEEVRHYVFEGVADGASGVFCSLSRTMIIPEAVAKIHTFIDTAKQVAQLLADGCPRNRLCEHL